MSVERRNPDRLLQQAKEEERQVGQGKLKIYLGAAPGVGKTFAMLSDALQMEARGLDIVIGVVESHKRQSIDNMAQNFTSLPKITVEYHGQPIEEFDLDAALQRNPGLILMDEMAHTNPPGLRHNKRWQDIQELLDRGIDVYTTLNVQHIESLNDDVTRIIAAPVKETVPDFMLQRADTIELVDLPPEDLLKRLAEGKVYVPEQAELALEHFFRKGNLIALRELALRTLAKRVNEQALSYRQGQGIRTIWPIKDKILICVGPGEESFKLIRAAKRMATNLQADWIAVYIDRPQIRNGREKRSLAEQNLRFAEQLGAETRILTGVDIVKSVFSFASEQNITLIMIWKQIRTRWHQLFHRSLADEIVRYSGDIDIYTMTGTPNPKEKQQNSNNNKTTWFYYGLSLGIVSIATLINFLGHDIFNDSTKIMVYLLGIISIAVFGKMGPSILGSLFSVACFDFFFIAPFYTFSLPNVGSIFTLLVMLLVGQVISQLTILSQRQAEAARLTEQHTSTLYRLSKKLSKTRGTHKLLRAGARYIAEAFDSKVVALLPKDGQLIISVKMKTNSGLNEKEMSIAQWVFNMGQKAGLGTDTLSFSDALYVPLLGARGVIGIMRVQPQDSEDLLSPQKLHLLEACVNQLALALEVERLTEIE